MGTYDDLSVGDSFTTPSVSVTPAVAQSLIDTAGYTHPLFTDPAFAAASPFGKRPLPGQAVLLLMGGLVEQSGRFDDTVIALLGFDGVAFRAPAFEGDHLTVTVTVTAKEDRGVLVMNWNAHNATGDLLVESVARMKFRVAP